MGGFILVHRDHDAPVARVLGVALDVFRGMGSPQGIKVESSNYVFCYIPKSLDSRNQFLQIDEHRFLACVGTLVYRASLGLQALEQLAKAPDLATELAKCRGHFVVIEGGAEGVRILRDPCGAIEVFADPERGVFSTSFLAVARSMPRRVLRRHEAYEYLFHGHTLGTETILHGIRRLDEGEQVTVRKTISFVEPPRWPVPEPASGSRRALAGQAVENLSQSMHEVLNAFDGRASLALSGGYDTRLVLALARRIGVSPELFVYGQANSSDVVVAKYISEREGLELNHIDKSLIEEKVSERQYNDIILKNYYFADGVIYGGIFIPPVEMVAQALRHRNGAVALHGGGGEVYRNFFGLPNRATSTKDISKLFYRVPAGIKSPGFAINKYTDRIAEKMDLLLGTKPGRIDRHLAEAIYPRFRYRSWIGKELSLNTRAGYCYLPLFDSNSVQLALSIPAGFKDHGNFEAEMINIADPVLAGYPSNYGYNFSKNVPMRQSIKGWILQQRPAWLRQLSFRLASLSGAEARVWHEDWASKLLRLDCPVMRDLIGAADLRRNIFSRTGSNLTFLIQDLNITEIL